jgi:hypothetical protein
MVIVWDNPNPNRTVNRPDVWEVIHKDGSTRIVASSEIASIRKPENGLKKSDAAAAASAIGFCF